MNMQVNNERTNIIEYYYAIFIIQVLNKYFILGFSGLVFVIFFQFFFFVNIPNIAFNSPYKICLYLNDTRSIYFSPFYCS